MNRFVTVQPTSLGVGDSMGICTTMGLPGAHSQQAGGQGHLENGNSFSESRTRSVRTDWEERD